MAMNSYRNYTSNTSALAKNLEKLSSGYKINRAGDDAAGLAISEKMREKLKEFRNSPRSIIAAFSAAVLFFCTVFTRLILKTDDGHFLGILHRNGFTVTSWLHERYTTVSGRIVGEWLMINFLRLPLIFWKLFIAALIIYIMY